MNQFSKLAHEPSVSQHTLTEHNTCYTFAMEEQEGNEQGQRPVGGRGVRLCGGGVGEEEAKTRGRFLKE